MLDSQQWVVKTRGNQTVLYSARGVSAGISITLHKKARQIEISGWYDLVVGIQGGVINLSDLVAMFPKTRRSGGKAKAMTIRSERRL